MEIWKRLPIAKDGYEVSNLGRIKCPGKGKRGSIVSGTKNKKNGYLIVNLNYKCYYVHRLVGEHFVPNPDNKRCINHLDGNKENNEASNLAWVTYSENHLHASEKLGLKTGDNHWKSSDKRLVLRIYELKKMGYRICQISKCISLEYYTIRDIYNGKNWRYLYKQHFH